MRAVQLVLSIFICASKLWSAEVMTSQDLLYAAAEKGDVEECLRALLDGARLELPNHKMETVLSIAISHRHFSLVTWLLKGRYQQDLLSALAVGSLPMGKTPNQICPQNRQKNAIAPQKVSANVQAEPSVMPVSAEGENQRAKKSLPRLNIRKRSNSSANLALESPRDGGVESSGKNTENSPPPRTPPGSPGRNEVFNSPMPETLAAYKNNEGNLFHIMAALPFQNFEHEVLPMLNLCYEAISEQNRIDFINKNNGKGATPLHVAITHKNDIAVKWFINHGSELNPKEGISPLQWALADGEYAVGYKPLKIPVLLVMHGAHVEKSGHYNTRSFLQKIEELSQCMRNLDCSLKHLRSWHTEENQRLIMLDAMSAAFTKESEQRQNP